MNRYVPRPAVLRTHGVYLTPHEHRELAKAIEIAFDTLSLEATATRHALLAIHGIVNHATDRTERDRKYTAEAFRAAMLGRHVAVVE